MYNASNVEQFLNLNHQLTAIQKAEIKEHLILYINHLLLHDFNKLVQILYRVDVNEQKLKELIKLNQSTDTAIIITELLIQRQEEKVKAREGFEPNNDIPENDKW